MPRTHSIKKQIVHPLDLKYILDSPDSDLYKDILKYAKNEYCSGFKFTEIGNWLIDNNYELLAFFIRILMRR